MTQAKHTLGPWATYVNKENDIVIRKMLPDLTECCEIARVKTGFHDARLIAAAPELLEALQEIVAAADGEGWKQLDATFSKARESITKATGASND